MLLNDNNMKNISLLVELMFCISPSVAMIERSFSTMNSIKTKLRSSLGQDMLNKVMHISMTEIDLEDEDVFLQYWARPSATGKRIQIGKIAIPALSNLKRKYKKRKAKGTSQSSPKKRKVKK